jgi:CheY-like chemotaxis protein
MGARVLLVDDDADGRELVEAMLDQGGAETRMARSAAEALAILDGWRPDALVSDIGMPGEDGYALIEKLRARERARGERLLPAIALTAYVGVEDRLRPSGSRIPARRKADRTWCLHDAAGEPPRETRLSLDPIRLSQVTLSSLPSLAFFP